MSKNVVLPGRTVFVADSEFPYRRIHARELPSMLACRSLCRVVILSCDPKRALCLSSVDSIERQDEEGPLVSEWLCCRVKFAEQRVEVEVNLIELERRAHLVFPLESVGAVNAVSDEEDGD